MDKELEEALGCFSAAEAEGLYDRLAELPDEERGVGSLYDLVVRRLLVAPSHIRAALASRAAPPSNKQGATQ